MEKRDIFRLAVLLAIALIIGVYIIATTVLIAGDGVFYIERAQKFSIEPVGIIKGHPFGYPFLIFLAHKFVSLFSSGPSTQIWIYSAQSITLLCRLLALIPLYLIGKILVGGRKSFLAVLILIMLPYPAEYGSDVVRDWPHILFLAMGMMFLMYGTRKGKWWMFAIAGLATGLGYTIREECAQIVIYAVLWLLISLFIPRANISRFKTVCLTMILIVGFVIPAAPYMKVKGEILPPKLKSIISCNTQWQSGGFEQSRFDDTVVVYKASGMPTNILRALGKLAQRISENLMYFFVFPLIIGFYSHFRKSRKILLNEKFFIFALMVLYMIMMVLLHINYNYISRRHCMAMNVLSVFFIPAGLKLLARWLSRRGSKNSLAALKDRKRWFFILLTVGFCICAVKFVRITPLRWTKQGYKGAAEWLRGNTTAADIIAVPDKRITFYAEWEGLVYSEQIPISEEADYIVRVVKNEEEKLQFGKDTSREYSTWVNSKKRRKLVIYKVIH